MSVTFNQAAVTALFQAITDEARQTNAFARVNQHEPKNAPGRDISASFWLGRIAPYPRGSGLASISGVVEINGRIGRAFIGANATEDDAIDPQILTATCLLMAAYSGGFTLGGRVRNVDLLGEAGTPLSAQAGYWDQDGKQYRGMEIVIPVIINDMWSESP